MNVMMLAPGDSVAVALTGLTSGVTLDDTDITVLTHIDAGHKVAVRDIAAGEDVIKYGYPIGHATTPIKAGEWVHSHNLATNLDANLAYR